MTEPKGRLSDPDLETEALVGTIVDGRYRLDAVIGRGGMGVVFRGEHVSIRRPVAVKVLHTSLAGVPELRGRFEREAWAIGRIDHPNCISIFDFGAMPDGSLYLAMELLDGEPLSDLLAREEYLSPARALRILRHVLSGLEHVHAAGIVHRDIKPENIIIVRQDDDREFAKLLDFGIAKMVGAEVDDSVKLTQAGMAFGTPVYMSPEQAIGNPIDGRADLYAISVLAFELMCGKPPFYTDDKIALLSMHTTREPPAMRDCLPVGAAMIPEAVEALLRRGLAKRPGERIPSASAYIEAIDDFLTDSDPLSGLEQRPSLGELTGAHPLVPVDDPFAGMGVGDGRGTGSAPVMLDDAGAAPAPGSPRGPTPRPAPRPGAPSTTRIRARSEPTTSIRRRPVWTYLIGGLIAAAIGVGIAVVTTRGDGPSNKLPAGSAAEAAAEKLGQGDPEGALRLLTAVQDKIQADPLAQLQLGHAHAALRQNAKALAAYDLALVLSPSLEADADLRAALAAMTTVSTKGKNDPEQIGRAFLFMAQRTKIADARDRVVAAAQDDSMVLRAAALPVVDKLGLGDRVDWFRVYVLDLEQGKTCDERKPAVAKLRALGDARAIDVLKKAIERKDKRKAVNGCLVDDASSAVVYLTERAGPPPAP
ncbi:MAG: serine/threonine protein kinase [Kofleriaceae bacterium]|nr:serine/threonine protein kinase [Kofleriaceae bacterium]MBP9207661.1 serine/threonine protein kinase [Kofleriaceae bacterium]